MRRLILIQMALTMVFMTAFCSHVFASDWYVEKYLKASASSRLQGDNKLTTQVNALAVKAEYQGESVGVNLDGEWQYDAVYDFYSGFSAQSEEEYGNRLWLNEAYISWSWSSYEMALGYQKVVWGEADDLRVVDVVNPLDLKDFVLFDLDEYRISQPMLRVEKTVGQWDIDGLWILASEPNQLPPIGSEFSFNSVAGIPESHPNDDEFGLQAQSFFNDTDISFYAFRGRNDTPIVTNITTSPRFEYQQETMLGMSLSRPVGDWVTRGELAWFDDRKFNHTDFSSSHSDVLQWLVGLDYLYKDWLFTGQATDRHIYRWNNTYASEESDPVYTLSADATLLSGKMAVRFAVSHADSSGGGQLYQSKLSYRPDSRWELQLNIDALSGDLANFFGQFSDNDRVWISTSYLL